MNDKLESLLAMYRKNEFLLKRNPMCFEWQYENDILFRMMERHIPQSHYDEINLVVYGIERRS